MRAGGYYNSGNYKDKFDSSNNWNSKGYAVDLAIYPGLAYAINKRLHIEAGFNNLAYLHFSHDKQTLSANTGGTYKTNGFSIGSSLSDYAGLTIGFRVMLN